jgi:hypothetical protein
MPDWQERITRETAPAIRAEHELRYRLVAPLVGTSAVWADLGSGTGVGAVAAFGDRRPAHAVLIDLDADAVAAAAQGLAMPDTHQLAGDLTDPDVLTQIGEAILRVEGERVATCFEVVEHLSTFIPLLEWAGALARKGDATFVMSLPNDAFWSIENPYHATTWGEGAFEELCRLLPAEQTLLHQVALTGSAVVGSNETPERHDLAVDVGGESTIATHFIAAFGPRHKELRHASVVVETDPLAQRRWERQRESSLALAEAMVLEQRKALDEQHKALNEQRETLQQQVSTQREQLRAQTARFDEWRVYIHELERELGRPLSGATEIPQTGGGPGNDLSSQPPSEPSTPQT